MTDQELDAIASVLNPLLRSLESLAFIARHFHPPVLAQVVASVDQPDEALRQARAAQSPWPPHLAGLGGAFDSASDHVLAAFDELRVVCEETGDTRMAFRALRHQARALEALYPLASFLPPISQLFLEPAARGDEGLQKRLLRGIAPENTGVMHVGEGRGSVSLYVPEYYDPARPMPFVMALHGGSGSGKQFLWTWLRAARSMGAILAAPTALGDTWALLGGDADSPHLAHILASVRARWSVDPERLLLTGMSDGGTFSYVAGLNAGSPFTHLAPVSAAFHPVLAMAADAERIQGLPIRIVHGALDWMFPIDLARQADEALASAGARVTYVELDDLSHCYPREQNAQMLQWLGETPGSAA